MSLDGHVFKKALLMEALKNLTFKSPNQLEDELYKKIKVGPPSWMMSFTQSRYVSIPINRVQDKYPNRCGKKKQDTPEYLTKRYNAGKRIDIEKTISELPVGTHQEYILKLRGKK